jgi:hypothetical protein
LYFFVLLIKYYGDLVDNIDQHNPALFRLVQKGGNFMFLVYVGLGATQRNIFGAKVGLTEKDYNACI